MPDYGESAFDSDPVEFDDIIQPFNLLAGRRSGPAISGRLSRLGPLVEDVIIRHNYPEVVSVIIGESLAMGATLAGALKFNGVFTLQMQGDGPISLIVVDISTLDEGNTFCLRSYAKYDKDKLQMFDKPNARELLGNGYLALTVDQGEDTERYQGLVEFVGNTLSEFAQHYFRQSQQIDAAVMVSAGRDGLSGSWRAACIMLQRVAEDKLEALPSDEGNDPWRRNMMLLATGTSKEMLDSELDPRHYLYRLFHEEGLRVLPVRPLSRGCRCSEERIILVLKQLPKEDLLDFLVGGAVEVTCEFCNSTYLFDPETLERRYTD
jgi:molecular chaperone Hsp33